MENFLRCFANAAPHKRFDYLHLAEFWYNTSWHSSLKQTPFFVLYGQSPRQLGVDSLAACSVASLEEWLQQKTVMQALIQQQLARAQNRMKMQADKHRTKRSFDVGTWVYVKLQPYVQTSLVARASQKLSYRFLVHTSLQPKWELWRTNYSCHRHQASIRSFMSPSSRLRCR